jgi:hypothetical protein
MDVRRPRSLGCPCSARKPVLPPAPCPITRPCASQRERAGARSLEGAHSCRWCAAAGGRDDRVCPGGGTSAQGLGPCEIRAQAPARRQGQCARYAGRKLPSGTRHEGGCLCKLLMLEGGREVLKLSRTQSNLRKRGQLSPARRDSMDLRHDCQCLLAPPGEVGAPGKQHVQIVDDSRSLSRNGLTSKAGASRQNPLVTWRKP